MHSRDCLLYTSAAQIISRINGFTFVETQYDYKAAKLNIVSAVSYTHLDVYKRQRDN